MKQRQYLGTKTDTRPLRYYRHYALRTLCPDSLGLRHHLKANSRAIGLK